MHLIIRFLLPVLLAFAHDLSAGRPDPEVTVTQPYIELHTGPGRGYPVFHIVERGEKVVLLKKRTDWIKVRTMPFGPMEFNRKGEPVVGSNTKEGWVKVDELTQAVDSAGNRIVPPGPSFEDLSKRHWEAGMMAGIFENSDAVSGYVSYHFTRNLSLEGEISEDYGNFSSGRNYTVSLLNHPFPHWRYSPYFTLGGGERETSPRSTIVGTEDRTDGVITVGGGLRIYLASRFLLRVQYKRYTILTSRDDDEEVDEWKIGLSAFF